jgi:hypothetical protein
MANGATLDAGQIILRGRTRFGAADSTLIPIAILHHQSLSPRAKLVYSKLLNYAWVGTSASTRRLASDLGFSPRGVRYCIDELTAARLLSVETRPGKPNAYALTTNL